ncbi:MAG: hypothetical protein M1816_007036 [Peltula sp. TS41687]|nr:MAG: hypothetical protein M1816_007036 [Peltula sp. TS41687]
MSSSTSLNALALSVPASPGISIAPAESGAMFMHCNILVGSMVVHTAVVTVTAGGKCGEHRYWQARMLDPVAEKSGYAGEKARMTTHIQDATLSHSQILPRPSFVSLTFSQRSLDRLQSWVAKQRSGWEKTLKAHDVIEVVHLTGLDQGQGSILEQRAAGDNSAKFQGNSTVVKDDCVRKSTDGAGGEDNDEGFPSITSILSEARRKGAVAKTDLSSKRTITEQQLADDRSPEGDRASAGTRGVRPGDSQDKPIELDDNEPDDHEQHGATSDNGGRSLDAARTGSQPGSSPSEHLSEIIVDGLCVHTATTDGVNGDQKPNNQNVNRNIVDDEERLRPAECQRDDLLSSHSEIVEGPDYDSAGQEAPASAGHIHDVFAKYEKMFGMIRMKQQPQKRKEQSSLSLHRSDSIRNGSLKTNSENRLGSVGEGNQQEKSTESMLGLEHSSTSTDAFNQDCIALQNASSRKLQDKSPPSNVGTQRNPPTQKRSRPFIESVAPSTNDLISKRPRRIRKKT